MDHVWMWKRLRDIAASQSEGLLTLLNEIEQDAVAIPKLDELITDMFDTFNLMRRAGVVGVGGCVIETEGHLFEFQMDETRLKMLMLERIKDMLDNL